MTSKITIERLIAERLFSRAPAPGDYYHSATGKTLLAVSRVRKVMDAKGRVSYRLMGDRVRPTDLPAGTTAMPWPSQPKKHTKPANAIPLIITEAQKKASLARVVGRSIAQQAARKRVVQLLRDDKDIERQVHTVRVINGSVTEAEWRDPEDMSVQRRVPRTVRGFRSADEVAKMLDRGTISKIQAATGRRFRKIYELGVVGLRPSTDLAAAFGSRGFQSADGPSEARLKNLQTYNLIVSLLGTGPIRIVEAVCIHNESIMRYSDRRRMNRSAGLGYFQASIDTVAAFFEREDAARRTEGVAQGVSA